eukprot:COSAG02_NODE_2592_length_8465_cov_2.118695_4_plen_83_part_00
MLDARVSLRVAEQPALRLFPSTIVCCTYRFTWSGTKNKAYQNVVDIVGGQQKVLSRRERPHVVLDQAGIPIALTNGVTEAWP